MCAEAPYPDTGRRFLVLGLGCERGTPAGEVLGLAVSALERLGAQPEDVFCVATLDARAEEPAIHAVARYFGVSLVTFPAARLEIETPRLATPSRLVFAITGCHGVAEAAALARAGEASRLVLAKTKSAHATVAIAESFQPLAAFSCDADSASSHFDSNPEPA